MIVSHMHDVFQKSLQAVCHADLYLLQQRLMLLQRQLQAYVAASGEGSGWYGSCMRTTVHPDAVLEANSADPVNHQLPLKKVLQQRGVEGVHGAPCLISFGLCMVHL